VGDALGLPREGLSRRRARGLFGGPPQQQHRFLFGRGMVSDDTEHTCLVGQALLRAPEDVGAFARPLAWRLRFWLRGNQATSSATWSATTRCSSSTSSATWSASCSAGATVAAPSTGGGCCHP
jgi:ADP-ribosylglycohydrolase